MSTDLQVRPGWLTALREAGKAGFTGLPTQRQEAWKYTGLNKLKALTFEPSPTAAGLPAKVSDDGAVASAHRLVFVNGRYDAGQSSIGTLPQGVVLTSLAGILNTQPALLETRLGKVT